MLDCRARCPFGAKTGCSRGSAKKYWGFRFIRKEGRSVPFCDFRAQSPGWIFREDTAAHYCIQLVWGGAGGWCADATQNPEQITHRGRSFLMACAEAGCCWVRNGRWRILSHLFDCSFEKFIKFINFSINSYLKTALIVIISHLPRTHHIFIPIFLTSLPKWNNFEAKDIFRILSIFPWFLFSKTYSI